MTFNKVLRGMQHERIKYQDKVLDGIKDENKISIQSSNTDDDEFERKIQELQSKTQKKEEQNDSSEK